jgi:proteasome lid subunit RPN8/RPN11
LLHLRDCGETEVGAFGVCPQEALLVEEIELIPQTCTYSTVSFNDAAVADFFEEQVDKGLSPDQFGRIWIHTHPGNCPLPSLTDEKTFARAFGQVQWAIMFILACGGQTYTRLRFNGDPAVDLLLETSVDFRHNFAGSDFESWEEEYWECVNPVDPFQSQTVTRQVEFELDWPQKPSKASQNGRLLKENVRDIDEHFYLLPEIELNHEYECRGKYQSDP